MMFLTQAPGMIVAFVFSLSAEHKYFEDENISWQVDRECLLVPHYDIACFPDGSPRYWLVQEI